jgi:hypothetical protein
MSTPVETSTSEAAPDEQYLPIEEVAERLDLPLGLLIRRVEAGDVPARRVDGPDGAHYRVRLSDLGLSVPEREPEPEPEPMKPNEDGTADAEPGLDLVGSAKPSSWPDKVVPPPAEELAAVSRPAASTASTNGSAAPAPVAPQPAAAPRDAALVNSSPRAEVANMALDPRELVAGLLDRWERTLEQRIYAEQRQRFETELNSRQNVLKQLQLELQAARAEHAAAQADKDRRLAEREREISDLRRSLENPQEPVKKRGWFQRG